MKEQINKKIKKLYYQLLRPVDSGLYCRTVV